MKILIIYLFTANTFLDFYIQSIVQAVEESVTTGVILNHPLSAIAPVS
ncbi:MAG TPA: hypothetical protein VIJ95_05020 [Hanamia sp.]